MYIAYTVSELLKHDITVSPAVLFTTDDKIDYLSNMNVKLIIFFDSTLFNRISCVLACVRAYVCVCERE